MTPTSSPEELFDNLAARGTPMPNIETRRDAQASGEYVEQPHRNWYPPESVWVRPNRV